MRMASVRAQNAIETVWFGSLNNIVYFKSHLCISPAAYRLIS